MTYVIDPSRFGGASWSPSDWAGLQLWFEVGDISDFWQDDGQTSAVTATGQAVGSWEDKSGNNNDLFQSSSTERPTYQGSYVQFTGSGGDIATIGDYLGTSSPLAFKDNDEFIVGCAFEITSDDELVPEGIFSFGSTYESGVPIMFLQTDGVTTTQTSRVYIDAGYQYSGLSTPPTTLIRAIIRVTKPSTNYLVDAWVNGSKQTQYDAGTGLQNLSTANGYLFLNSSFRAQASTRHKCLVCSFGSYSDVDVLDLDGYLSGF